MDQGDDEDPGMFLLPRDRRRYDTEHYSLDVIQGADEWSQDLGMASRRDPDAMPPANAFQWTMHWIHDMIASMTRGNVLFAIKAGYLTGK